MFKIVYIKYKLDILKEKYRITKNILMFIIFIQLCQPLHNYLIYWDLQCLSLIIL